MAKPWQVVRHEGILLRRNKGAWLFALLYALAGVWFCVYNLMQGEPWMANFYATLFELNVSGPLLLGMSMLGVYLAQKDRARDFESLLLVWQVKNSQWLLGKWLLLQLYGACFTVYTLLVMTVWFVIGHTPPSQWAPQAAYVLVMIGGAVLFATSFGFWIGTTLRSRLSYLLPVMLWGVLYFIQQDMRGSSQLSPYWHLVYPYNTDFYFTPYGGIFELSGVWTNTLLHQGAVILFALGLTAVALATFRPKRQERRERVGSWSVLAAALVPTILLGGLNYAAFDEKLNGFIHFAKQRMMQEKEQGDFYDWKLDVVTTDYTMDATDLDVQVRPDDQIQVKGVLKATNRSEKPSSALDLTLFSELQVRSLTDESGHPIPYERDVDHLHLTLPKSVAPGQAVTLNIAYDGSVYQTSKDGLLESSFAQPGRLLLRKNNGWYPLIGVRDLAKTHEHNNRVLGFETRTVNVTERSPTDFTVRLHGAEGMGARQAMSIPATGDGTFAGRTTDLTLVGGQIEERNVEGIRVLAHPDVMEAAEPVVKERLRGWTYLQKWLQEDQIPQTVLIVSDTMDDPMMSDPQVKVWAPRLLKLVAPGRINYAYTSDLPLEYRFTFADTPNLNLLRSAMRWNVFQEFDQTFGRTFEDEVRHQLDFLSDSATPEEVRKNEQAKESSRRLAAYDAKGHKEFEALTRYLYQQYKKARSPEEFSLADALDQYEKGGRQ
jgi:hypothetical protein